jgi:2,4-dienoyl-CoA reductase-like NADH-dependent reductase (Old Yellow Enzyme family)
MHSPVSLYNAELKNRFVLAPLTRGRATATRVPNKIMGDYYEQRATAGLVIAEATVISQEGIRLTMSHNGMAEMQKATVTIQVTKKAKYKV